MEVSTAALKGALIDIGRVVDKRTTIPVLTHVLLTATRDTLTLSATDLDVSRLQVIPGETTAQDAHWQCAAPWAGLKKAMPRKIKDGPTVGLDLGADGLLNVEVFRPEGEDSAALSYSAVRTLPADEFPILPELDEREPEAFIAGEDFHGMLSRVVKAISKEDSRFQFAAARIELNGKARAVATDGHRLHMADADLEVSLTGDPCGKATPEDLAALLPGKAVRSILMDRSFKKAGRGKAARFPRVLVKLSEHHISIESSRGVRYVSRLCKGTFPEYQKLWRDSNPCVLSATVGAMLSALDGVEPSIGEIRSVHLDLEGGARLIARNPDLGDSEATVDGAKLKGGMTIPKYSKATEPGTVLGLNPDYLRDFLSKMDEDSEFRLCAQDETCPVEIQPEYDLEYRSVIMPIRL